MDKLPSPEEIVEMQRMGDIALKKIQEHESLSKAEVIEAIPVKDYSTAKYSYEIIIDEVKAFEAELDNEHEVAIMLSSFGQSVTLTVTDIGYVDPSTLIFYGYVGEQIATLIQHVSQLNFLLLAVKKPDPEKAPRRIGFAPPNED